MKKTRTITILFVIVFIIIIGAMLTACNRGIDDNSYNGNITYDTKSALELLSSTELGDNVKLEISDGNTYAYSVNGENFTCYRYSLNDVVTEYYIGKKDGKFYKLTIVDNEKTYKMLTEYEAAKEFESYELNCESYINILENNSINKLLEESKAWGSNYGTITADGNGYKNAKEDAFPFYAYINLKMLAVTNNSPLEFSLAYNFSNGKIINISINYNFPEGFVPDNSGSDYLNNSNCTYYYDTIITMPAEMGTDTTDTGETTIFLYDASILDSSENVVNNISNQVRGSAISIPDPIAKEGAVFAGWYYDNKYKFPVTDFYICGYSSNSVYAKWTVTLPTLKLNGGKLLSDEKEAYQRSLTTSDITNVIPIKTGYSFVGWYTDAALENALENPNTILAGNTYYAKWEKKVKITLVAQGLNYNLIDYLYKSESTLRLPEVVKKGGIFEGWFTDNSFTTEAPVNCPSTDTTFYAKFNDAVCVTINTDNAILTFGNQDYINIPITETDEFNYNDLYYSLSNGFNGCSTLSDELEYVFDGWYLDAGLTQEFVSYPISDITIYPSYSQKYYFVLEAGSNGTLDEFVNDTLYCINWLRCSESSITETLIEMESAIYPKEGYVFSGWYTDSNCTIAYNPTTYPRQTTTLYAGYILSNQ